MEFIDKHACFHTWIIVHNLLYFLDCRIKNAYPCYVASVIDRTNYWQHPICAQFTISSTPSCFLFGPAFNMTRQYCLVFANLSRINSSVMVVIESSSQLFFLRLSNTKYITPALLHLSKRL